MSNYDRHWTVTDWCVLLVFVFGGSKGGAAEGRGKGANGRRGHAGGGGHSPDHAGEHSGGNTTYQNQQAGCVCTPTPLVGSLIVAKIGVTVSPCKTERDKDAGSHDSTFVFEKKLAQKMYGLIS